MIKQLVQVVVLAIVLLAGFAIKANAQICGCAEVGPRNPIAGYVKNSQGQGVSGVTVAALAHGQYEGEYMEDVTDLNGYFSFSNKGINPPYNYPVRVCHNYTYGIPGTQLGGYIDTYPDPISPQCPDPTDLLIIYDGSIASMISSPAIEKLISDIFAM